MYRFTITTRRVHSPTITIVDFASSIVDYPQVLDILWTWGGAATNLKLHFLRFVGPTQFINTIIVHIVLQ